MATSAGAAPCLQGRSPIRVFGLWKPCGMLQLYSVVSAGCREQAGLKFDLAWPETASATTAHRASRLSKHFARQNIGPARWLLWLGGSPHRICPAVQQQCFVSE